MMKVMMSKHIYFLFWIPLILVLLSLSTSCGRQYYTVYKDPNHVQKNLNMAYFKERGEKYTRRGGYLEDISQFSPEEGESYDHYYARMINTLQAQEEELEILQEAIDQKQEHLEGLQGQLFAMREQEGEMRLALAQAQEGNTIAEKKQAQIPFEQYVVRKGDTLQQIAFSRYGTYTGWLALYRFNHKSLPHGPNRIEEGMTLVIPNANAPL